MKFAEYAKMYMALAALIAQGLLSQATFLPTPVLYGAQVVAIVAGAFAVWKVENKPSDPPPPAWTAGTAFPAWDYHEDEDGTGHTARPELRLVA